MQSNRTRRHAVIATTALLLILAPLASRADDTSDDGWAASSKPSAADVAAREQEKLNGYVTGYNTLLGTFGLSQQLQQYLGQRIAAKGLNDPVFVNVGWLGNGLTALQSARAIKGGPDALDRAADPLIATVDGLVGRLNGLAAYYRSRGQLADNFARGKREDPLVLAAFRQALQQMPVLAAAIEQEQDRRDQEDLDALKASGDRLAYDVALAMLQSKHLLRLFHSDADLHDAARLSAGDALAAQIDTALADAQTAKSKPGSNGGISDSMDSSAAEALETFIGHWRDLRRNGNPFNFQMMVASYNNAVEQHNRGQL